MSRKPAPKSDNLEQSKRFIEMARELGPDETGEAFDRALKTVARPKGRPAVKRPGRKSD